MLKSIAKQLGDVPAGGHFFIRGSTAHRYLRTAWEFKGDPTKIDSVLVVDLESGEVKRLATTLNVIETARR